MTALNRPMLAALLLLATGLCSAEIFRCTARDGGVTYQQDPCAASSNGGAVNISTSYPDYSYERERLALREAALDARLLKRLEIEANERIARDERIAREKEAQAALALAQAQQAYPLYGIARPLQVPRRLPHRPLPAGVH
ncbi:MAG TPA: DUF4124 domain-containing protein [Usitatibacter sp.]